MSNHHVTRCPRVAISVVALSTLLACASGGATNTGLAPSRSASDTSSIGSTDGKTMETLFEGRFPGISVQRTNGGGLKILVRGGTSSFFGGEEPLYVLDDTPLPTGTGGVVFLNPNDIQKIEVLKNPADVGIYGLRGANGVIVITTKRAKRP